MHRGQFSLSGWSLGDEDALSPEQRELIDEVMDSYGQHDASALSRLTHGEDPWREARSGLPENAPSSAVIDPDAMQRYYRAEEAQGRKPSVAAVAI